MQRRNFLASSFGFAAALAAGSRAFSEEGDVNSNITRIEEDWYILVGDPDPEVDAPQIVTVFGPGNPLYGMHSIFELNHGTQPDFAEGGMQLQCWRGNDLVGYRSQFAPAELSISNEVIKFTTATEIVTGGVLMEVINGVSECWGEFGGTQSLRHTISSSLNHLGNYRPSYSIRNSRVTFGSNRVKMFKRTEIRYFRADGIDFTTTEDTIVEQWAS